MRFLFYGLAAYILYLVIRAVSVASQVWRWVLKPVRIEPVESFPDNVRPLFKNAVAELTGFGFEPSGEGITHTVLGHKTWTMLFHNPAAYSYATLELNSLPDPLAPVTCTFYTFFANGETLLTLNNQKYTIVGSLPDTEVQDGYLVSLAEQWELHHNRQQARATEMSSQRLPQANLIARLDQFNGTYLDHMVSTGQMSQAENEDQYFLTPVAALAVAIKLLVGYRKSKTLQQQRNLAVSQNRLQPVDIPLVFEVEAYQTLVNQPHRQVPGPTKILVGLVSLLLFIFSFLIFFDWQILLALILVVSFHELGHFVAMKSVGYKNLSLFFIPFFGAAVTGQKQNVTLAETMLVLFAGPVPGIVLSIALLSYPGASGSGPMRIGLILLLVINYANLLPLFPLDGGRIISHLLFTKQVYGGLIFRAFATTSFVIAGIWLEDFVLLTLALLVGVSLPATFRYAKVLNTLMNTLPQEQRRDEEMTLTSIFATMKQLGMTNQPFLIKYQIAKAVISNQSLPEGTPAARLVFAGLYLVCLSSVPILWFLFA